MEDEEPHLLRLSRHASASSLPSFPQISLQQASWPGKILTGLGQWWSDRKQSSETQFSRSLVVSAGGAHIAILYGYRVHFFSRANGFDHAIGSILSPVEAGFYLCGVWLEDLEIFAAISSFKQLVVMDTSGKELSRIRLNGWKTNSQVLGMFVKRCQDTGSGGKYALVIFCCDCSIYRIEYGPEGFYGLGSEVLAHTPIKKLHPKGVTCYDFNSESSVLALAVLSRGTRLLRSAGTYGISVWRIKDCWSSVELLGFVEILQTEDCSGSVVPSMKLILSPTCDYIGLLDSVARLQLLKVKKSSNSWILESMECGSTDMDGSLDGASMMACRQADSQSKFSYFEISSVSQSKAGNGSPFEGFTEIRDVCWWSENSLVLLNKDGLFVIASVPELQIVLRFGCGVISDGICMTHAFQRCIYMLESIAGKPNQQTVQSESEAELKSSLRLVILQEFTVTKLFKLVLESAEFDFALDLSQRYKLDKDIVHKRQWLISDWDLEAVQRTLIKIEDKSWVLKECLERVCPTLEAMQALLRHGLDLVELCVGSRHLKHAFQDGATGYYCLSRLRLLQYSDRLETYLGLSLDRYTSTDYEVFRQSPLEDVAVRLAESGRTGAVSLLYKRHVYSLTPFLFTILDAFPETLSPHNYAHLLPTLRPFKPYIVGREKDWVEEDDIIEIIKRYERIDEKVSTTHLNSSTEHVVNACIGFGWPSETDIIDWYHRRASTIDRVSGQLENALTLLDLGKQKGLSSLEDLWEDFSCLHWVTYNSSEADEDIEMNLTLEDWQQLTDYEKFQAMLQGVNESNVCSRLDERAVPFLNLLTRRRNGTPESQEQGASFIVEWIKELAANNRLQICAVILAETCKDFGSNKLFRSHLECIHAGLDCIYACPAVDQWDAMDIILSKLHLLCSHQPKNEMDQKFGRKGASLGVSFSMYNRSAEGTSKPDNGAGIVETGAYSALERRIEQAIGHVDAGRLLSAYQVPKPIKFLEKAQNDERGVKQLILSMLSKFGRRQPAHSDAEWATMWDHLQRLQARAFTFLNRQFIFMEYYSSLLKAGKFSLAKAQLKTLGNNLLSPQRAEAVIIQVSRDYLFSASSLDSPEIDKARLCLNLAPESKNILAELDYIDTLTMKLPALGVLLLPMQVKQTKDPMEIVKKALMSSSSTGYLQVDDVLDIAKSLGLSSEGQIAEVKEAIAREAAASGQITLALEFCRGLMRQCHGAVWDLCAALARGPELEEMNLQLRKDLLGFALSQCDDTSIGQLLQTWKEIDLLEQSIVVKEGMNLIEASSSHFFEEGRMMEAECNDEQEGLLSQGLTQLLCKVAHLGSAGDTVLQRLTLKDQKKLLRILCLYLPWLVQAANAGSLKVSEWQQDGTGLVAKSVATILLGLAHSNLLPRDELLCPLAHVTMSRVSKDSKSLVGCGLLLNFFDTHRAADFLEQEMQHEELTEACKVLNLASKFAAILHGDTVTPNKSPKIRRQHLLTTLRQPSRSPSSEMKDGTVMVSENTFWNEFQSRVMTRLDRAEHALELKPIIQNFSKERFVSGEESYVKDTILSLVKFADTSKGLGREQASVVDKYQISNHTYHLSKTGMQGGESSSLNFHALESKLKILEKYLKDLSVKERNLSFQTLMSATANSVLEETGQSYGDDDCWKERFDPLLQLWDTYLAALLDEESPMEGISGQAIEVSLELRVCLDCFRKLIQNDQIPRLQAQEVIAKLVDLQNVKEERVGFLKAMVMSGCPYQTVLFVWQNLRDYVDRCSFPKVRQVPDIYVQVITSSVETCSGICRSAPSEGCCSHLDAALKAVASLSKTFATTEDESLHQGSASLHESRVCVWKTVCHLAENADIPPFLRVWLLKLREAISKQTAAPQTFGNYLKDYTILWFGWDATGPGGEMRAPLQNKIMAVKSTELISEVWPDTIIKAEDLVSVEEASFLFDRLLANVQTVQQTDLLIKLLEEWGDLFGWERSASKESMAENFVDEKENECLDAEWGHADGWEDVWEEPDEATASSMFCKRDSAASVNSLHVCWKNALSKLVSFGELDSILRWLDSTHPRYERTVLTKEESLEIISLLEDLNPTSALKISLLLPYVEAQDQALESLSNKIRVTRNRRHEREEVVANVDDCLLILVLASGRFSIWIDDVKFSASFRPICAALASVVFCTDQFSPSFMRDVVLPYFVATLTPTSQYTAACALALQCVTVHPVFITWNGAHTALTTFLKANASVPCNDLDKFSLQLKPLSCISNSIHYLHSQLRETLGSALNSLLNIYS